MLETIIVACVVEAVTLAIGGLIAIPQIKRELKILNEQFAKANETQGALVQTVIRMEERLENHIHDTHIHKN